jgi:hypothetical protein
MRREHQHFARSNDKAKQKTKSELAFTLSEIQMACFCDAGTDVLHKRVCEAD